MDVSFIGGPQPQHGVGVVAPFDFALDRELWRWVPDDVSLRLTRTPFVPVGVSLDLARIVSEHETLREAVRALGASEPEVVAYACTSGSFVGGIAGERAMCEVMNAAGEVPSLTTSGALLQALAELGAGRIALLTPYTESVTRALEEYLGEAGVTVTGCRRPTSSIDFISAVSSPGSLRWRTPTAIESICRSSSMWPLSGIGPPGDLRG